MQLFSLDEHPVVCTQSSLGVGGGGKFISLASGSCLPVKHPYMLICLFSVVHITSVSGHYLFFGLSIGTTMEETSAKRNACFVQPNTITVLMSSSAF